MKKILYFGVFCFCILAGFTAVGEASKETLLVYHYPFYFLSEDVNLSETEIDGFVNAIEEQLATNFEAIGKVEDSSGTAKLPYFKILGAFDGEKLSKTVSRHYPMVVFTDGHMASRVLDVFNSVDKQPMILIILNAVAGVEQHITDRTRRVINVSGDKENTHIISINEKDEGRVYNIIIKNSENIVLFKEPKLTQFLVEMISRAMWDTILTNEFSYGAT